MIPTTNITAGRQRNKLNKEGRKLYMILKNSELIYKLRSENCCITYNVIVNFTTKKEAEKTYFMFDIAESLQPISNPNILRYRVKGSFLETPNGINFVYIVTNARDNSLYGIYADNTTKIKENIFLNEVLRLSPETQNSQVEYVSITTINKEDSSQNEKLILEPNSEIYKLYLNGKIDILTLCNLAFMQSNNNETKTIESAPLTRTLSKHFINQTQ